MPVPESSEPDPADDAATARTWSALLAAAAQARRAAGLTPGQAFGFDEGRLAAVAGTDPRALLVWQAPGGWTRADGVVESCGAMIDLYLPVCNATPESPLTVGHLGQGLDGHIATNAGDSYYVTGPANLLHLHRMRALCDAVVVGADTVATDDPRLTVRRATGPQPVRVILDPQRRLPAEHRVFADREAPTLLVCDSACAKRSGQQPGLAEIVGIPANEGRLDLAALLAVLHARKLYSVFVEGGGRTVSAFLGAGLLDRLQIAIAPLITGAGRCGIDLPARERIGDCLRPAHRIFAMGDDVLFDCDLRSSAKSGSAAASTLSRIL